MALLGPLLAGRLGVPALRLPWSVDFGRSVVQARDELLGPLARRLDADRYQGLGDVTLDPCPASLQVGTGDITRWPMRYIPYNGSAVLPVHLRTPPPGPASPRPGAIPVRPRLAQRHPRPPRGPRPRPHDVIEKTGRAPPGASGRAQVVGCSADEPSGACVCPSGAYCGRELLEHAVQVPSWAILARMSVVAVDGLEGSVRG